jgi:subtilisin family serine protease
MFPRSVSVWGKITGKRWLGLPALAVASAALALSAGGAAAATEASVPGDREAGSAADPGASLNSRVIVQWREGADRAERAGARADAGVTYAAELGDPSFQLVETEGGGAAAAAAALEADPAVAVAEPDGFRRLEAIPNDPLFAQQWGLQNTGQAVAGLAGGKSGNDIDVVNAWNRTVGTPSTIVADIDSGYRADSPDLGPVEWTNPGEIPNNGIDDDGNGKVDDVHGWDFVGENSQAPTEDNDPTDSNLISGGHGVHTAGIIGAAGDNGTGISGVAQNVRIMPLRVCANEPGLNEVRCPFSSIIAAINYAGNNGARVANLSLGGTTYSQLEVNAYAEHPETLYVIAAGNDSANHDSGGSGIEGHHYGCDYKPATEASPPVAGAIENTICVAALDPSEALASYSDYGAASVDLGAPGTAVLSTFPTTQTLFSDNFETNDFATKWSALGIKFGRANELPQSSFGITDTPGAAPEANHIYGAELTNGVAVAPGTGACRLEGRRFRKGGGQFGAPYGLNIDGTYTEFNGGETAGSAMVPFRTVPILGLGGHTVKPFFEYHATAAPTAAEGAWLDDIALNCNAPLSTQPSYAFEEGTSMATPHVTGAAALLFSLKPTATVTQVREALLTTTKATPSLAGKTVTGGRLDVSAALNKLVPLGTETTAPETEFVTTPPANAGELAWKSEFHIRRVDADGGTLECKLDSGAFTACGAEPPFGVSEGIHTLQVRAKNEAGIVDPTPASFTGTVDETPPALAITEAPSGTATVSSAKFGFTATDASGPVTTRCSIDGAAFAACTSPKSYGSLADGVHEFAVVAEDAVGNNQSATRSWTIDTSPPALAITDGPSGSTTATDATFRFTATDPSGPVTTECSLDGAAFAACTSPKSYGSLALGGHEFTVRAEDALGHATSATRSWSVSATNGGGGTLPPEARANTEESIIKASPPATPTPPPGTPPAGCTVPKLAGKTLGAAKAALSAAGCKVGKVTPPKVPRGSKPPKPVVKSTTPAAGGRTAGTVAIKLAAKPKRHHH